MKKVFIAFFFFSFLVFLLFRGLYEDKIKIGFLAGLSGKYSEVGHSLLNGTKLAFEEIDYELNGKEIEIISKDDRQEEAYVKLAIEEFRQNNVKLILGSGTSYMTNVALKFFDDEYQPIIFSASASSNSFSKKDDNFLRTHVSQSPESFTKLSNYLIKNNIRNIYAIYDSNNSTYSKNYIKNFEKSFISKGGNKFFDLQEISSNFSFILENIKKIENIDAIVIIGTPLDSSKLVQYLKINGINKPIIGSSWEKGTTLLENGGKYIEGMIFLSSFNSNSQKKSYLDFVDKYKNKYDSFPDLFALQAYETAKITIEVLKNNDNLDSFKETLLKMKDFNGLQSEIIFDKYGDSQRDYFLMTIKNGVYQELKDK
ncbi:hypothetical protein CP965_04445 [Halarcobacter mediterraneus]|uniref:Leucine-binding protein domain-containing protein n=1 Tax=Halarcobacter mediterraneus TaxID=2023153 RepID=A0A4Q1AXJ8_9BACT|nr:ABC transporter substrate-binding protein [Halarcobacter mediterraneus]RXK13060.1 hypothetical protein CP965_04445 [Halarcobacter mediterraneus]